MTASWMNQCADVLQQLYFYTQKSEGKKTKHLHLTLTTVMEAAQNGSR